MDVDLDRPPEDEQMDYEPYPDPDRIPIPFDNSTEIAISPGPFPSEKMEEEMIEYHPEGDEVMDEPIHEPEIEPEPEHAHAHGEEMEAEPTPPIRDIQPGFSFATSGPKGVLTPIAEDVSAFMAREGGDKAEIEIPEPSTSDFSNPDYSSPQISSLNPASPEEETMPTSVTLPLANAFPHAKSPVPTAAQKSFNEAGPSRLVSPAPAAPDVEVAAATTQPAQDENHAGEAEINGEEEEAEEEDYILDAHNLPSILLYLPKSGIRTLFSPLLPEDENQHGGIPIWLEGTQEGYAEASLADLWGALRAQMEKEGLCGAGELILTEKSMALTMGEDDVHLSSITLLDLIQVYLDCELPVPVKLYVTFQPNRFISRFNAIQKELGVQDARRQSEVADPSILAGAGSGEVEEGYEEGYEEHEDEVGPEGEEGDANEQVEDVAKGGDAESRQNSGVRTVENRSLEENKNEGIQRDPTTSAAPRLGADMEQESPGGADLPQESADPNAEKTPLPRVTEAQDTSVERMVTPSFNLGHADQTDTKDEIDPSSSAMVQAPLDEMALHELHEQEADESTQDDTEIATQQVEDETGDIEYNEDYADAENTIPESSALTTDTPTQINTASTITPADSIVTSTAPVGSGSPPVQNRLGLDEYDLVKLQEQRQAEEDEEIEPSYVPVPAHEPPVAVEGGAAILPVTPTVVQDAESSVPPSDFGVRAGAEETDGASAIVDEQEEEYEEEYYEGDEGEDGATNEGTTGDIITESVVELADSTDLITEDEDVAAEGEEEEEEEGDEHFDVDKFVSNLEEGGENGEVVVQEVVEVGSSSARPQQAQEAAKEAFVAATLAAEAANEAERALATAEAEGQAVDGGETQLDYEGEEEEYYDYEDGTAHESEERPVLEGDESGEGIYEEDNKSPASSNTLDGQVVEDAEEIYDDEDEEEALDDDEREHDAPSSASTLPAKRSAEDDTERGLKKSKIDEA